VPLIVDESFLGTLQVVAFGMRAVEVLLNGWQTVEVLVLLSAMHWYRYRWVEEESGDMSTNAAPTSIS